MKYVPDWNVPQGKVSKHEGEVHLHPHDLIALVHKKKGFDQAGKLAIQLLAKKYDQKFEETKQ